MHPGQAQEVGDRQRRSGHDAAPATRADQRPVGRSHRPHGCGAERDAPVECERVVHQTGAPRHAHRHVRSHPRGQDDGGRLHYPAISEGWSGVGDDSACAAEARSGALTRRKPPVPPLAGCKRYALFRGWPNRAHVRRCWMPARRATSTASTSTRVIAALLVKMLWQPIRRGQFGERELETAAFDFLVLAHARLRGGDRRSHEQGRNMARARRRRSAASWRERVACAIVGHRD